MMVNIVIKVFGLHFVKALPTKNAATVEARRQMVMCSVKDVLETPSSSVTATVKTPGRVSIEEKIIAIRKKLAITIHQPW